MTQQAGYGDDDGWVGGQSASDKVGFHGATPSIQRTGVAGTALPTTPLATTNITSTTGGDGARAAAIDALRDRVNLQTTLIAELRATLIEKGLHTGAA